MSEIDLSLWRSRIEQAVGLQTSCHRRWRDAHRMAAGEWQNDYQSMTDTDYTPVNYAKAYCSSVVASIYARNPYLFCKSRNARYVEFAHSMETVLNYFVDELNLKAQMKRVIPDALITGIGWIDVGYTATFGSLNLQPQDDAGLFQRLLSGGKRASEQGVLNEYVKEISPYAVRLSPWNVFLAPGYHAVSDMPFLVIAEDLAPEELQTHPLYKDAFGSSTVYPSRRVDVPTTGIATGGLARGFGSQRSNGKLTAMHRLWHVWDRRENQRFIWLDGSQDTAGPYPWNLSIEGFPQVPLIFNDLPETDRHAHSYPISDLTYLMPQLKEINRLRSQMVRHRKRSGGLILAQETALTDEQAHKIQNSDDLTLIRMKGNPSTDLSNFRPGDLPPDVYRINDRILADLDLVGQQPFLLPAQGISSRNSATRDTLLAQESGTLRGEKVDVIEEVMKHVSKRLAAVIWEYAPRALIQEILGEDQLPENLWPTLPEEREARRDMIERELNYQLDAGSTQPLKDRTLKNEQKLKLLNIIGGIAPERIKITSEGLGQLVDDFDMPELRNWMVLDDEGEQQAAEQENQYLAQGLPQVVSPNENHELHEKIHAQLVMSGQSTPAAEQHLLQHREFRMQKSPQKPAQAGDGGATRGASAKPEVQRQGMPGMADLIGAAGKGMKEPGSDKGGMSNV